MFGRRRRSEYEESSTFNLPATSPGCSSSSSSSPVTGEGLPDRDSQRNGGFGWDGGALYVGSRRRALLLASRGFPARTSFYSPASLQPWPRSNYLLFSFFDSFSLVPDPLIVVLCICLDL
ncbi:hypothetical protein BRADI_5g02815v3 [Brachypodium distachyon]|uniref:Uncharacterized protein n=1 Tax=Brachypodium distachyon TaxID=15368 RepID=A0A2K2CF33_BRADI|nr:hypothetical protein BRADI_5g02815v3 [Brachypodium distachyon]